MKTSVPTHPESVRAAILWRALPGYVSRCVEALARHKGVQLLVYCQTEGIFSNVVDQLKQYPHVRLLNNNDSMAFQECLNFKPHVAVISLTRSGLLARVAAAWGKTPALVIGASDHFWKGDWRDYANGLAARLGAFSPYEAILVPGILGKMYAQKIGFPEPTIFEGLYTCDTDIFRPIGRKRHSGTDQGHWPRVFLFVGQYIHRKGLDILLKAYEAYRRQASDPWELWLVGRGELEDDLGKAPGVKNLGAKSSPQIAEIMLQAGCLVIPSRVDHWGMVIHEAACAGLPILASSMCAASVELVRSGFNGYVFPVENETMLTRYLLFMDQSGMARDLGKNSLYMARQFSPELWAKKILCDIPLFVRGAPFIHSLA